MKHSILIFLICVLILIQCNGQGNSKRPPVLGQHKNVQYTGGSILDFYRQYSTFTDPGEFEYLYEDLPDSLPGLCQLIQKQFMHIVTEYPSYKDIMPGDSRYDITKYTTIESILETLYQKDSNGLTLYRKPENRLVFSCQNYALMLASMLKYKGIPARVRYGHATYLIPDFHASHVICEVWNKTEERWMLVDPNVNMIDFSRDKFAFSNEAWLQMQKGTIDANTFGFPGKYSGEGSITGKICGDLASTLGTEYPLTMYPPIMEYYFEGEKQLPQEQIKILDSISKLMQSLNAENLLKLQRIYNNTPEIQVTKSRDVKYLTEENTKPKENFNDEKPVIEFVDIPSGIFMMGSPENEIGRMDDEVQHEVTVSAFKMSKYTITVEQYNIFCKATDRRKPFYGLYGKSKNPVTQVTWYDAMAFAEWLGCRLPTEAECEYAARANTTTPFYTGNCVTTDQANFNGEEPYADCENGIKRKRPIAVGSFLPNGYGLFDMHGNIWEWCNDWYGKYDVNDTINPQGPDTGTRKVNRGGAYYDPAWRCRSAYRAGGDPPDSRGAGISFRIVKSK